MKIPGATMNNDITVASLNGVISEIKSIVMASRQRVIEQVNTELLQTYWNIGRVIVENEQKNQARADYGAQTLKLLSKSLTADLGKGFSRSNIYNMRQFYLTHKKFQTVSGKLSWSHYCELLGISDNAKRQFYEKESENANGGSSKPVGRTTNSVICPALCSFSKSPGVAETKTVVPIMERNSSNFNGRLSNAEGKRNP